MSEFKYSLFHQRTAENISVEIARLRDSLISKKDIKATGSSEVDIESIVQSLDVLLSGYILDFKTPNPNERQLKTRQEWHDFLTETNQMSFNECLLILLGISPTLSNLIEPTLYKIKLNEIKTLQDKHLSLIFFQRVENHLLRERFRSNKIKTDDFIKWAFDYKYLRVLEKD